MTGGQKTNINLESSLDIKTSDMLVPVSQQTFQHNWQKYQGKFLPNSLRFEKNGWAAGWCVYNFDYSVYRKNMNGYWLGAGQFNTYTKMVSVFEKEDSYESMYDVFVVTDNQILSGDAVITGNMISGKVGEKDYQLEWNPAIKELTVLTAGISIEPKINDDFSVSVIVIDTESSYSIDMDLLLASQLSSDAIDPVNYEGLLNNNHSWGSYVYNIDSGLVSTPENISVPATIEDGNLLKFDYNADVTDELISIAYQVEKYYDKFSSLNIKTTSDDDKLYIADDADDRLAFDKYTGSVSPNVLKVDEDGVKLDVMLPTWLVWGFGVSASSPKAKWCNNSNFNEVGVRVARHRRTKVKYTSVYDGVERELELTDTDGVQFLNGMQNRFCQIIIQNTIEPSVRWDYRKNLLPQSDIWCFSTRRYENFREGNTALFDKIFGNVYTYGTCTYKAADYFEYNNPYDWTDRDNAVYTDDDISDILSIKKLGDPDSTDTGADQTFVNNNKPTDAQLRDLCVVNTSAGINYDADQDAKQYSELYNANGVYIGGTYSDESIDLTDANLWLWPRVPRFNFAKFDQVESPTGNPSANHYYELSGSTYVASTDTVVDPTKTYYTREDIQGVYWTDGTNYIDDFNEFRETVLGTYDDSLDKLNEITLTQNSSYSRTRVVKVYKPFYDFNKIPQPPEGASQEEQEAYQHNVENWNKTWNDYYPDIDSPQTYFDESKTSDDDTYFDYNDIEKVNFTPILRSDYWYLNPGVYIKNGYKYYIEFGDSSGIILYEDAAPNEIKPFIWHHGKDVTTEYSYAVRHTPGEIISNVSDPVGTELPFYFGSATTVIARYGASDTAVVGGTNTMRCSSAKFKCGINYNLVLIEHEGYRDDQGYWHDPWVEEQWSIKEDIPENNWLRHAWLQGPYINPATRKPYYTNSYQLGNGIEDQIIYGPTVIGDEKGVKAGICLKGHILYDVIYPEMKSQLEISQDGAFVFEPTATDDLTTEQKQLILIDRNDTVRGQTLYKLTQQTIVPDADGKGYMTIAIEAVEGVDNIMFYAVAEKDASGNLQPIKDFYLPGTAYGYPSSTEGNMTLVSNMPKFNLKWTPHSIKLPTSATGQFSNKNTFNSSHKLYSQAEASLLAPTIVVGEYDKDTQRKPIDITINDITIHAEFDMPTQMTICDETNITVYDKAIGKVVALSVVGMSDTATIPLDIDLIFNDSKARFYKINTDGYSLLSVESGKVKFSNGTMEFVYNPNMRSIIQPRVTDQNVTEITNGHNIKAQGAIQANINAMLQLVSPDGSYSGTTVTFEYKGDTFSYDFNDPLASDDGIIVKYTDIREPEKTNILGKIKTEGQYQLLRQQWNTTVEVENFWWIDSKHVLELNNSHFVLKRNTGELHDWDGNRFIQVDEVLRSSILPTNVIRHFVTNCYNTVKPAHLVTLQEKNGQILGLIYNPRKDFKNVGQFLITIRQKELGQNLNDVTVDAGVAIFNTYNPLGTEQIISKAIWSSTIVNDRMIIGCHLSDNYDQWALVINLNNYAVEKVIQGYGYVGLNGCLTGGQIPNDYFDVNKGFNSKVEPLTVLQSTEPADLNDLDKAYEVNDLSKLNNLTPRVVGTTEQQWYIQLRLFGIVSHLTFNGTNFEKQLLPITNNYTSIYRSPSFGSSVLGDSLVQATALSTMFKFGEEANAVWQTLMSILGQPCMFFLAPRYATLCYLQQTFGQYAYVHYNSSKSMVEEDVKQSSTDSGINEDKKKQTDPVLSSSFTFDKQKFTQEMDVVLDYWGTGILAILISAMGESLQQMERKLSINEEQNQSAVSDVGKKYLDNVVSNAGDLIASGIMTQSRNDNGLTSYVTGLKSLDMFYSTCDQQRVYAGPGYVEHQMVANCVAQSVTDVHVEGKVQQFFYVITALTVLQARLTIAIEEGIADGLDKLAEITKELSVKGTNIGVAIATVSNVTAIGIRKAIETQKVANEQVEKILNIVASRGITVNVDSSISKHALSVEGKHKYGEKNEVFMWPCWGVKPGQLKYTDECVNCGTKNTPWDLNLRSSKCFTSTWVNGFNEILSFRIAKYSETELDQAQAKKNVGDQGPWYPVDGNSGDRTKAADNYRAYRMHGLVPYFQAAPFGVCEERTLPDDMAKIEGVTRFLPNEPFKNENIGVSEPAFAPSLIHDYIIDKRWDLAQCATYGLQQWVTVKDTKITNCPPSNMIVSDDFCGVACPYTAIEVKRGIQKAYMRPWAITPTTLAFNCTGYNTIFNNKLYHSFDGLSQRIVDLIGSPGFNKNRQSFIYAFQINDRFKRSNIIPANEAQGNFEAEPVMAMNTIDKLWCTLTISAKEKGLEAGTIGEDKDAVRWAIPIFTEPVSTLPACVKTMAASTLAVVEGITSLVTAQVTDTNAAYKAPMSVDFTIGKNVYRATEEYICSVQPAEAGNVITDLIPSLGLKFIGSTPTEAFFYSKSTRCYYVFTGSSLTKMDMMERFRDIQKGYWDFVNQEVIMPCLMTFKRLNAEVEDKDSETDNIIIPVMSKSQVSGELPPPITTIFNDRSWYKCVSLPCGFAYQGPNRVIINRSVFIEYMERSIKDNFNKWSKMNRERYVTHREYPEIYDNIMKDVKGVDGWTYNPFVLVTSPLGLSEDTDCLFEWVITFCWPVEMDLLYGVDNYACVNIMAETMTPGGKVKSRPTHIFLTKELFTRSGNYGYYSFRFQSKNGMGNRERLHIWSDQYIAISSIDCEYKPETSRRTEQLTQQLDVQKLKEL